MNSRNSAPIPPNREALHSSSETSKAMNNNISRAYAIVPSRLLQPGLTRLLLAGLILTLSIQVLCAGSAMWDLNPLNGDWNTAANWTPATVPNGSADTATFRNSSTTDLSVSGFTEVNRIVFSQGGDAYTIVSNPKGDFSVLNITGAGISNDSGIVQNFVAAADAAGGQGGIGFDGFASAGSLTTFTNQANPVVGIDSGVTDFLATASAGNGTFINEGGVVSGGTAGVTVFFNSATAANAILISSGGTVSGAPGGSTTFTLKSHARNATLIASSGINGGGGGQIVFWDSSSGDTARVELFGNGFLSLAPHKGGVTVGSLEGDGVVQLFDHVLSVGSNDLSTTFSGVIEEGSSEVSGGALTKLGAGTLTLTGANTYPGSTRVTAGSLELNNATGSATGTGAVKVDAGTLGGTGIIAGTVTVGSGSGAGAFLTPGQGARRPAALTIQSALTFKADATYACTLNSKKAKADQVVASGITIESGAQFKFIAIGNKRLSAGQVFTAISNTSATLISGAFANLPDGSTFTAGRNSFQVSYEGGDGNDLTLTVAP